MKRLFANNIETQLAMSGGVLGEFDTTILINEVAGFPEILRSDEVIVLTIEDTTNNAREIVHVTATDFVSVPDKIVLTVDRSHISGSGYEGSSRHTSLQNLDSRVYIALTSQYFNEMPYLSGNNLGEGRALSLCKYPLKPVANDHVIAINGRIPHCKPDIVTELATLANTGLPFVMMSNLFDLAVPTVNWAASTEYDDGAIVSPTGKSGNQWIRKGVTNPSTSETTAPTFTIGENAIERNDADTATIAIWYPYSLHDFGDGKEVRIIAEGRMLAVTEFIVIIEVIDNVTGAAPVVRFYNLSNGQPVTSNQTLSVNGTDNGLKKSFVFPVAAAHLADAFSMRLVSGGVATSLLARFAIKGIYV